MRKRRKSQRALNFFRKSFNFLPSQACIKIKLKENVGAFCVLFEVKEIHVGCSKKIHIRGEIFNDKIK